MLLQCQLAAPSLSFIMLSHPFARLLIYRAGSTLSYQILAVTAGWHIYSITHDVVSLGLLGLAEVLPYFCSSLFAGHAVDVLSKRWLAIAGCACHVLIAMAMVLVVAIAGTSSEASQVIPLWIYAAVGVAGLARSLLRPSYQAMLVRILEREQLARAAAIGTVVFDISLVTGPMLGGFLIAWTGVITAYVATGLCALIAISALLLLRYEEPAHQGSGLSVFASIAEGLKFVFSTQIMLAAITLDMFAVLFGGAVAVLPAFIHEILNGSPENLGLLRAMPALGSILISLWLTRAPLHRNSGKIMMLSVAGFGLATIAFGFSRSLWVAAACLFLTGLFDGVSVVLRHTILQLVTPQNMQGRVSAINGLFIGSSNELGALESGIAADLMGLAPSIVFGGSMTLVVVAISWIAAPRLRELHVRDLHARPAS